MNDKVGNKYRPLLPCRGLDSRRVEAVVRILLNAGEKGTKLERIFLKN